ncbi:uncharacterized protein TRUGW13939_11808 [Talaromyces rugulosus]|uniref:Enoyl reductase (ER) domain-containing protein n=1 Tax=Talaromyces rugulosus TaxID=121627 RepID=A0A7H8RJ14_TALRU|nr:uncharacterized protein TRUGW13939_11808 [Talaromyces rugulosus]QKX64633.1 hypothetical protein TRUGW13939_11808 [Talaromyces rugulosus]
MAQPQNQAAWITAPNKKPFDIQDAPYPSPGLGELVIKSAATAINPVDWQIQARDQGFLKYPFILGEDVAGVVVEVGPEVTRFSKGQRVLAYLDGLGTGNPAHSSFQLYVLAKEILTAEIPDSVAFEQAAVLPIALATSAAGLFQEDALNFPLPSAEEPKPTGKTVLVWGGASSVGATAIQLAVAAGLTVISTASSKNFELVKSLGVSEVYDYKSPSVIEDVVNAISGTDFAGVFDAISETSTFDAVRAILAKLESNVKVVTTSPYDRPTEQPGPKFVIAVTVAQDPHKHVAKAIWNDFVPKALENGRLKTKPNPEVVGKGLHDIQHAVDVLKEGVSAKKIVVNF